MSTKPTEMIYIHKLYVGCLGSCITILTYYIPSGIAGPTTGGTAGTTRGHKGTGAGPTRIGDRTRGAGTGPAEAGHPVTVPTVVGAGPTGRRGVVRAGTAWPIATI